MVATGGVIPLGSGIGLIARIVGNLGTPITQASLSAIAYAVTNLSAGLNLGTGTFAVASCVFDALQQADPRWVYDSAAFPGTDGLFGYNFLGVLPASLFPEIVATPAIIGAPPAASQIQATVTFTPTVGQPFVQLFSWRAMNAFSG